jgi:chloramphenicol-sensitive protein RarD
MNKHYASAIAGYFIWGFFPLVLRSINTHPAGEILYFRILFSLIILLVIIGVFLRRKSNENWKQFTSLHSSTKRNIIILTLLGGLLLSINWLAFIYVVNEINIKTASFSYLICPVITAVLGYVMLHEKMAPIQWFAIFLCACSCILMGMNNVAELGYSLLIAFSYALYLITQRKNQGFNRMIVLGAQVLFAFMIMNFFVGQMAGAMVSDVRFYVIVACIALFFTVLPLFLNLYALNKINAATIGILMYIIPLINFMLAFFVVNETATSVQIAGYAVIAIALVIFNYPVLKRIAQ